MQSGRHLTIDLHKIAARHICHDIAELAQVLRLDDADEDDNNWDTVRNLYRKARKGLVIGRTRDSEIKEMSVEDMRRFLGKCYYLLFHKVLFRLYNDAVSNKKAKEVHVEAAEAMEEESFRSANSSMTEEMTSLKDELLKCQREVNQLQKQIIDMQSEELKSVRSVTETVQKDLNSWSAVVAQNCAAATAPRKIGAALRTPQPPKEDSRAKNLIVFGLPEEENETVTDRALTVFEELDEKPPISSSCRLGTAAEGKTRPIRVTLESRDSVLTLLRKARQLRSSEIYSRVYLCPDRTIEERRERRENLQTLEKLRRDNPERQFELKRGVIQFLCNGPTNS